MRRRLLSVSLGELYLHCPFLSFSLVVLFLVMMGHEFGWFFIFRFTFAYIPTHIFGYYRSFVPD